MGTVCKENGSCLQRWWELFAKRMIAACQESDRVECLQRKWELFAKKMRVVCKENESCLQREW